MSFDDQARDLLQAALAEAQGDQADRGLLGQYPAIGEVLRDGDYTLLCFANGATCKIAIYQADPPQSANFRCPCCGDDVTGTGPACGDCLDAGCPYTMDASGDWNWSDCERVPEPPDPEVRIEYPSAGATYHREEYGVYRYDTYPENSVNAGQERRSMLGSYKTLEEAQAEHPDATWEAGTGYREVVIPQTPPGWFDPANAGERWNEDD